MRHLLAVSQQLFRENRVLDGENLRRQIRRIVPAAYGNRPETFYYAPVGELFAYEDAVAMLKITEEGILNPSDIDLYLTVDGVRVTLRAGKTYSF